MSEDILYKHLRDVETNVPYATIAMKVTDKGTYIGGSLVSPKDNPSYKEGRRIANFRLEALMNGKFPKNLACFVANLTDRKEAIEMLHDLEISREPVDTKIATYHIFDPNSTYNFIYEYDNIKVN